MQVTGGYFADPGFKEVPRLAQCGYPIAEVAADGSAIITKLTTAGGMVTPATVREQLLYEVHDPARYVTPDVIADFSCVRDCSKWCRSRRGLRRARDQATGNAKGDDRVRRRLSWQRPGSVMRGLGLVSAAGSLPRFCRSASTYLGSVGNAGLISSESTRCTRRRIGEETTDRQDARDVRVHVALRTARPARGRDAALGGRGVAVLRAGRRRGVSRTDHAERW